MFGEHAVVYGHPAIAAPVTEVRATAVLEPAAGGRGLTIIATDIDTTISPRDAARDNPLAEAARLTLQHLAAPEPDAVLSIRSTIPIASGMGSGAAVSTAIVRALAEFLGKPLHPKQVSDIVFEVEKIHHGTPSGIDNTVIAFEQLVYFTRGRPIEILTTPLPFRFLIADTGIQSCTRTVVEDVRSAWKSDRQRSEGIFDRIGAVSRRARRAIEHGAADHIGSLMNENHALLQALGVSAPELDQLVEAARQAGALGAKMSGAGRGGNIIALVNTHVAPAVEQALIQSGAARVIPAHVNGQAISTS